MYTRTFQIGVILWIIGLLGGAGIIDSNLVYHVQVPMAVSSTFVFVLIVAGGILLTCKRERGIAAD